MRRGGRYAMASNEKESLSITTRRGKEKRTLNEERREHLDGAFEQQLVFAGAEAPEDEKEEARSVGGGLIEELVGRAGGDGGRRREGEWREGDGLELFFVDGVDVVEDVGVGGIVLPPPVEDLLNWWVGGERGAFGCEEGRTRRDTGVEEQVAEATSFLNDDDIVCFVRVGEKHDHVVTVDILSNVTCR